MSVAAVTKSEALAVWQGLIDSGAYRLAQGETLPITDQLMAGCVNTISLEFHDSPNWVPVEHGINIA